MASMHYREVYGNCILDARENRFASGYSKSLNGLGEQHIQAPVRQEHASREYAQVASAVRTEYCVRRYVGTGSGR